MRGTIRRGVVVLGTIVAILGVMVGVGIGQTSSHGGSPSDIYTQTWPEDTCNDVQFDENGATIMEQQVTLQVESNLLVYFSYEIGFRSARQEALLSFGLDDSGPDQEWGIAAPASTTAQFFGTRQSGTMMWTFEHVEAGEHSVRANARVSTGVAGMNGCNLNVIVTPVDAPNGQRAGTPIGTGRVHLDTSFLQDPTLIRAFVPTGSLDEGCLATLAESNFPVAGTTLYCSIREFEGQRGLMLGIFLPNPVPDDTVFHVNVYQPYAQGYGEPVPYIGG